MWRFPGDESSTPRAANHTSHPQPHHTASLQAPHLNTRNRSSRTREGPLVCTAGPAGVLTRCESLASPVARRFSGPLCAAWSTSSLVKHGQPTWFAVGRRALKMDAIIAPAPAPLASYVGPSGPLPFLHSAHASSSFRSFFLSPRLPSCPIAAYSLTLSTHARYTPSVRPQDEQIPFF